MGVPTGGTLPMETVAKELLQCPRILKSREIMKKRNKPKSATPNCMKQILWNRKFWLLKLPMAIIKVIHLQNNFPIYYIHLIMSIWTQCVRMDLNKRSSPEQKTITASKGTS